MLTRRRLLAGGALGAAGACVARAPTDRRRAPLADRLGIQLYMMQPEIERDLTGTLRALRAIGYAEVETSPLPGRSAASVRAALDDAGLTCPSLMTSLEPTVPGIPSLADPGPVIEYARAIGAGAVVVAMFPFMGALARRTDAKTAFADFDRLRPMLGDIARDMGVDGWLAVARRLDEAGDRLNAAGLRLGYHNHNPEFVSVGGGRTAFDLFIERTDPRLVEFELDVGWVAAAGLDPATLLRRYRARITQLHLKDFARTEANTSLSFNPADVGAGLQRWPALIEALRGSAVRHAYVEQEPPFARPRMEAARIAYAYLQPLLARKSV